MQFFRYQLAVEPITVTFRSSLKWPANFLEALIGTLQFVLNAYYATTLATGLCCDICWPPKRPSCFVRGQFEYVDFLACVGA